MGSFRFLASRRWALFAVAVVLLAWAAWELGQWQFDRLEQRRERNAIVRENIDAAPVPAHSLMAPGQPVAETEQWRHVRATGRYVVEDTVVVRYRSNSKGDPGVQVVVPLVLADGSSLLVDRGWVPTDSRAVPTDVPAPEEHRVTVTGWLRADATGDATGVSEQAGGFASTRAISSVAIEAALGRELLNGFVELQSEEPSVGAELGRHELPELNDGPHFFYGLQWWFFGLLAICGFGWLLYDEWRTQHRKQPGTGLPAGPEVTDSAASPRPREPSSR